jgi:hypothetical protein
MTPAARIERRDAAGRALMECARNIAINATHGRLPTVEEAERLHRLDAKHDALDLECLADLIPDRPDPDQLVIPLVCAPVLVCGECAENNCDNHTTEEIQP